MVSMTQVVGVDPGLVHTGVVSLLFKQADQMLEVRSHIVSGPNAIATWREIQALPDPRPKVYVEQYRPRQRLNTDVRMVQAEQQFRNELPGATFLNNMGIKRVVTEDLMRLLQVWKWPTVTHHQDLRSAARIALLGMMKNDDTNVLLADVVRAHLDGEPWMITHV